MITIVPIMEKQNVLKEKDTSNISMTLYNHTRENLNESVLRSFIDKVSKSPYDCNKYWKPILEMAQKVKHDKGSNIYNVIKNTVLWQLNKDNLNEAIKYVSESEVSEIIDMEPILEDNLIITRIASNHNALSKRFNFDKLASEYVKSDNVPYGVYEMCELINTYDISENAKFNIALENITYAFRRSGYRKPILENIVDYFLSSSVIPDNRYSTMQSLVENSKFIENEEKKSISYFLEADNNKFEKEVIRLANKCNHPENKDFILSAVKLKTEKQAAGYIELAINKSNKYKDDAKYLIGSIFCIPLIGNISKAFVSYQYKLLSDKHNVKDNIDDNDFNSMVDYILDDEDDMIMESELLENQIIDEGLISRIREVIKTRNWKKKVKESDFDASIEPIAKFNRKKASSGNLDTFYRNNDYCIEGVSGDDQLCQIIANRLYTHCKKIDMPIDIYVFDSNLMNKKYDLAGKNAYPKDYHFVVVSLKEVMKYKQNNTVAVKGALGARWFNDIVDNNEYAEYRAGRHKETQQIQWLIKQFGRREDVNESVINDKFCINLDKVNPLDISSIGEDLNHIQDYSEILESEEYADSQDIKAILKDFKAEQKKDMGKFKYYLSKIYRKSPESIIDDTPHILSTIRVVFILTPMALPVIGPIIALVMTIIDKLLSMKINDKESEKLIRKLESERDKVDKDIEKHPDKKDELEKYGKCIDQCIKKVDAYREAHITSDELENRRGNSSKDDDLDFDFGGDDDFDFNFEAAITTMEAISIIAEAETNNLTYRLSQLCPFFDSTVISDLSELMKMAPRSINENHVLLNAKTYNTHNKPLYESVELNTIINSKLNYKDKHIDNTINDIIREAYIVKELTSLVNEVESYDRRFITEASIINKIKLTLQAGKGKLKDLSTKEKSMWQTLDIYASGFTRNLEKALTSNRREGIIKGSLIPSFSKCIKSGILVAGVSIVNPVLGIITAMGMIGASKALNDKERKLIYDEIDTELKVVEKEIEMANNDGDIKKYRMLLQYQKRLEREKQRIKYGVRAQGRNIPDSRPKED